MKVEYRGFEIDAHRERSLGGDLLLYYSVFRIEDGWEMESGFQDSAETTPAMIGYLKELVDDYYVNPQDYDD